MSQPPEPRSRQAARLALKLVERAAHEVIEREFKTLPQTTWKTLSDQIARTAVVLLDADFEFCKVVSEGDVADPKGNINPKAVLDCLKRMADNTRKDGAKHRLLYLAQHFEKTMTDLHLLKECDPNGQAKTETP